MVDISLLVPSRQRPEGLKRLYQSALDTADRPEHIEVVTYIDDDDDSYDKMDFYNLVKVRGPRIVLSEMWNECWKASHGNYLGHMGDDIVFRTEGWDTAVKQAIDSYPGSIAFVWGNDMNGESAKNEFGTHGFIHHMWADLSGYFVPPYFVSDYNDTWFNDVAEKLGVRLYLENVVTEHMHFSLGKSEIDQNTQDRLDRHAREKPQELYNTQEMRIARLAQAERLRRFINEFKA